MRPGDGAAPSTAAFSPGPGSPSPATPEVAAATAAAAPGAAIAVVEMTQDARAAAPVGARRRVESVTWRQLIGPLAVSGRRARRCGAWSSFLRLEVWLRPGAEEAFPGGMSQPDLLEGPGPEEACSRFNRRPEFRAGGL